MKVFIGVDPGASGGMCVLEKGKTPLLISMPDTPADVWEFFSKLDRFSYTPGVTTFAHVEKVSGYIGEKQPGSAMFKFGTSYGMLLMALTASGTPYEEVTPQKWQRGLGISPRKSDETKSQFKSRLKRHAQSLFPATPMTLKTCDALLIAEHLRRTYK